MLNVELQLFSGGYCTNIDKIAIKDGKYRLVKFPAIFGLLKHPTFGYILFDTGYSEHFIKETKPFPFNIYAKTTPVYFHKEDSAIHQLEKIGIRSQEIKYILISHFHADHIAGLLDFPNAHFLCFKKAYDVIKNKKGISALKQAFIPNLLPKDFEERVTFIDRKEPVSLPKKYSPFESGFDILDDGSMYAVDLTGHAIGQFGIFLQDQNNREVLLSADATWSSRAFRENIPPHKLADLIIPDKKSYLNNLHKLHLLYRNNPTIHIMPSHCTEIWKREIIHE